VDRRQRARARAWHRDAQCARVSACGRRARRALVAPERHQVQVVENASSRSASRLMFTRRSSTRPGKVVACRGLPQR
jgi:hypothetical protein